VVSKDGKDTLTRVGITCALCHSTVDNSVTQGIGQRLDGYPNLDLNPGAIIALSPALSPAQKAVYNSWGPGRYDPRFNIDGINGPVVIPPAYGLMGVPFEIYTGDGPISYWNNYVAVTQMGGHGSFSDPRLGIDIVQTPDLVTPKLPALLEYQLSLPAPPPPAGSFDRAAATRGQALFNGAARCGTCHIAHRRPERLSAAARRGRDGHGSGLRDAQRHQEVPHHAAARALAARALLPRRQRGRPAGGGRALQRALLPGPHADPEVRPGRVPEVTVSPHGGL
jgi:hypothetical protein